jgi:hypothetical protein
MRGVQIPSARQARNHGGATGCTVPTRNLAAPARNLQNIEDKHADQPAKTLSTPFRIHVLPL